MNMIQKNAEEIRTLLYGTIAEVLASSNTDKEIIEIKNKIDMLNKEMMQYIEDEVAKRTPREKNRIILQTKKYRNPNTTGQLKHA